MNKPAHLLRTVTRLLLVSLAASAVVPPSAARAQLHGARIQKACTGIKRCPGTCTISGTACVVDTNCPPGDKCSALGAVCTSSADCPGVVFPPSPPGLTGFCIGGPDAGSTLCATAADCRAPDTTVGCSTCVPVQETAPGDTMTCEISVTNVDTANSPLPAPHAQAI